MNTLFLGRVTRTLVLLCSAVSAPSYADWALSTDPAVVRPNPDNYQLQAQNPPGFTWARHPLNPPGYVLELTGPSGVLPLINITRNWYLPNAALPVGTYSWRVRGSNLTDWSTSRSFVIDPSSTVFVVPDEATVQAYGQAHGRPRALPVPYPLYQNWTAAELYDRNSYYNSMRADVIWRITSMTGVSDSEWVVYPVGTTSADKQAQDVKMGQRISTATHQLEAAALLYRLTLDPTFLNEATTRGDQLAALDPISGPTAYIYQDQASRQIALSLIKGADLLWNEVNGTDATRRSRWLNVVSIRGNDMYTDLSGSNGRLDQYPFDSHGGSNLGYLAATAILALGDVPSASTWFNFSFRDYAHIIYAWSGPEGGFANGTPYAQYTANISLSVWQALSEASGINFFNKPWSSGFLRYFTQFIAPGSPGFVFGDQHELAPTMALMKAYAARIATPAAAWYSRSLTGTEDALTILQAPYPLPAATVATPAAPPNAALFPSIGWVAMHSDITSVNRTSLYFKSSPYGAYNHSHGDQNSIVLNSGPRRLLVESGYMDYYGSSLWNNWYRQTKAHNAVTFDGGIGQLVTGNTENLTRNGQITAFSTTAARDFAEGNALAAYGTVLSKAQRQVWYLRTQDAAVVLDKIASPLPHVFEWNFHGYAPIVAGTANGERSITNVDRSVCIRPISTNLTYADITNAPAALVPEYHGVFKTPSTTSGEFLMLIDVGCKHPAVSLTATSGGRTLTIGADSISIQP